MNEALIAQFIGLIASAIGLACYLVKGRSRFLRTSSVSMVLLSLSYWLLGANEGAVVGASGALCCWISSTLTFKEPEPIRRVLLPAVLTAAVAIYLHTTSLHWWGFAGLLLASFFLGRVSDWMPTDTSVRWMMMPILVMWLIYSVVVWSWGGMVLYSACAALNAWRLMRRRYESACPNDPAGAQGSPSPSR